MSEPVRVLHVVTNMSYGGLENLLMNYYRCIDRSKLQFDFLTHVDIHQDFEEEIAALGGRLYRLSRLNPLSPGYLKELTGFFQAHPEYKIVHSHLNCMSAVPLRAAKRCGVPVRIAHAHTSSVNRNLKMFLKLLYRPRIPRYATNLFACGEKAGDWMFGGKPYTIMRNAIDAAAFRYDPAVSQRVRQALGVGSSFVVGHVGQFRTEKNHLFLIDVFAELLYRCPDSRLMLVGKGPMMEPARQKADALGISDKVLFLGARADIPELMQAMDVFVLPSLYEGFGIALIEAQAAGLPCVKSDTIAQTCVVTDLVSSASLTDEKEWAEAIAACRNVPRTDRFSDIACSGYEIAVAAQKLQRFYLNGENL